MKKNYAKRSLIISVVVIGTIVATIFQAFVPLRKNRSQKHSYVTQEQQVLTNENNDSTYTGNDQIYETVHDSNQVLPYQTEGQWIIQEDECLGETDHTSNEGHIRQNTMADNPDLFHQYKEGGWFSNPALQETIIFPDQDEYWEDPEGTVEIVQENPSSPIRSYDVGVGYTIEEWYNPAPEAPTSSGDQWEPVYPYQNARPIPKDTIDSWYNPPEQIPALKKKRPFSPPESKSTNDNQSKVYDPTPTPQPIPVPVPQPIPTPSPTPSASSSLTAQNEQSSPASPQILPPKEELPITNGETKSPPQKQAKTSTPNPILPPLSPVPFPLQPPSMQPPSEVVPAPKEILPAAPKVVSPRAPSSPAPTPVPPQPSAPVPVSTPTPVSVKPAPVRPAPPAPVVPKELLMPPPPISQEKPVSKMVNEITINFNNVAMVEYIRFISRLTGKNFLFDEADLQFNITVISEEPTSLTNLMSALLQELQIRGLALIEQGNNIIIHRNPNIRSPGGIVANENATKEKMAQYDILTRVFHLNTLDPNKAAEIIRPMLSTDAQVLVLRDSNNLIITDIAANILKINELIKNIDAPESGLKVSQYIVRNVLVESLAALVERIIAPMAQGSTFVLVPHSITNSIYIISNPYLVERALSLFQHLDSNQIAGNELLQDRIRLEGGEIGPGGPGIPLPPGAFPPGENEWTKHLPVGHIDRTMFYIHKLRYRRGDQIERALRQIATSMQLSGSTNVELIEAINSIQWIEASNSLIFTGIMAALEKIKELINEVDVPLRQVFVEMLILDTTITDALNFGVDWTTRFGGGGFSGAQGFLSNASILPSAADTSGVALVPNPRGLARVEGFSLGIVGQHLTHCGLHFNTLGALVKALHDDTKINIIMNPKILTEDNHPAEIFVGFTDRFKTQSVANDFGTILTNNFTFIDVGTRLKITPLIGNNDIITLEIEQEITNNLNTPSFLNTNIANIDVNLVPVLSKNKTTTRVHVPNKFFLVISGMISDENDRIRNQVPCLGGIPILGAGFSNKSRLDNKRNLMIFMRPQILDTEEEMEYVTRRQQDIQLEKSKFKRSWNYEINEALDFFNLKQTDPDERCSIYKDNECIEQCPCEK